MVVSAPSAGRVDRRPTVAMAAVLIAALFAFCHPYIGIRFDAALYMMRALADLDPAGLGRDLMVVDDGQMRFSLFPLLLRPLVGALGAAQAAMLVAALGSAAWLAALASLAWRLAPGRIAWAMVAMVAVLPLSYGDHGVFSFAETSATPRPLAEAAVMAGLAALLADRRLLAALAFAVAALLHPIMATAGIGVAALVLFVRLPTPWRIVAVSSAIVAIVAACVLALVGVAPLDRLVVRPDTEWLALLHRRSPHLFPTLWTSESFAPLLAQALTIVVAAHRVGASQRRLLLAALVVCIVGLVGEAVLGDVLHLLIFIETQAWRTTWLIGVLGGCALALCTSLLWQDGPRGRVVLALVGLAWFFQPTPLVTLALGAAALTLEFGALRPRLSDGHALIVVFVAAFLSLFWASGAIIGYAAFLRDIPAGAQASTVDPLRNNLQSLPLYFAIAAWLVAPAAEAATVAVALPFACVALLVASALAWDQRSTAQAYLEHPQAPAGLDALAAGRRQEVFWVGSFAEAWFALRRPQYFSPQQGSSVVFSRPLAREWRRRADALIKLGLEPRNVYTPWKPAANDDREHVTQSAIDALCTRPDAPGLVVFPHDGGQPSLRDMILWPLPAPFFDARNYEAGGESRRIDAFGIVPCAPAGVLPR